MPDEAAAYRERKNRPLKNPLKGLVVVHTDKEFLADIEGEVPHSRAGAACHRAHLILGHVPLVTTIFTTHRTCDS